MYSSRLITVFGATGAQGGAVVNALLKDGWKVRGVTRNPNSNAAVRLANLGVQVVPGDLTKDAEDLRPLFQGAHGAFIVTNPSFGSETNTEKEQGLNSINAAKHEGLQHLVFSSLPNVADISHGKYNLPHFTNKALAAGYAQRQVFPYCTSFGAAFYYQNFTTYFTPKKDENGEWTITLPATSSITMYDVEDTGPVVAAIFKDPRGTNGKYIASSGFHGTLEEVVAILNKATGKNIKLNIVPREEFAKFDFKGAKEIATMFGWFDEFGYYGEEDRESGKRLYPQMKRFETYAASWNPFD